MEILGNQKSSVNQQIDLFLAAHGSKFFPYQLADIKRQLSELPEQRIQDVMAQEYKDPTMVFLISLIGGYLGIDRFILNDVLLGVLKLITCGGFFIWVIIDWFLIQDAARDYNYNLLTRTILFSRQ